jgi:hypothetical protein
VGFTSSTDLPTVTESYQRQAPGYTDAFIGRVPGCIITLPTYESFFPAAAGGYLLDVYASSESCFWTPVSDSPWVEIQFFTGTGTGQMSYAVQENTGGARTANITIGPAVFKVKQVSGACLYLGGTGSWFGSGGGAFALDVFGSCPWTATSNVTWVTIQSGSGAGNGLVQFTVEPNASPSARTGQINVSGVIYEVNQVGAPAGLAACETTVFPLMQTYPASGGNASISVTAPAGCQWTASSPVSWVALAEGAQRTGNGAVSVQVQVNPWGYARFAQLRVGGQTFTVVQEGQ